MNTNTTEILKKAKLKATPLRIEVLKIFTFASHALSNHEIEGSVGEIDRITLYRTLKSFEEKGLIHKITDLAGNAKYAMCEEACLEHHHHHHNTHVHFQCEKCHLTFCVENVEIPDIILPTKFKVTGQNITMTGKCEKCL